jgi:hypothetical protein
MKITLSEIWGLCPQDGGSRLLQNVGNDYQTTQRHILEDFNYINPVRTSQETHYVSATKPNRLMLFGETVAVYCENHTEHTDTLCG